MPPLLLIARDPDAIDVFGDEAFILQQCDEQIQLLLGHVSVQTTERYLG